MFRLQLSLFFFTRESLSGPTPTPLLRKHMPSPDHLRMNILLIPTPVSFFFPSSFSVPCSPRRKRQAEWEVRNTPFNVALESCPADQLLPAPRGVSEGLTSPFRAPAQSEGRKVAGHLLWTFPNLGFFGIYSHTFFTYDINWDVI